MRNDLEKHLALLEELLDITGLPEESLYQITVPLAREGGMTTWILVDKNQLPSKGSIFCSCGSFQRRSVTSDAGGNVEESIVHGIARVFYAPEFSGRGYAARHMKDMAKALRNWQSECGKCVYIILYGDTGESYCASLGYALSLQTFTVSEVIAC